MYSIGAFFGTLVVQLPILAVLVLGFVLLSTPGRRLPGRAGTLARFGLGLMLAHSLGAMTWSIALPELIGRMNYGGGMVRNIGYASALVGFMLSLLLAAGLGLVIAALVSARPADPGPAHPPPGWNPAPPPGSVPPDR